MRVQREKIQSEREKDKRFEGEGGVQVLHFQRGARLSNEGIPEGEILGEVTVLVGVESPKTAGRAASGVRAAKSSESRKGE